MAMTIEEAIMFLAEPWANTQSPGVTRAAEAIAVIKDRLAALQRVSDAAHVLVHGDNDKASDWETLRAELRALGSSDGQ